MESGKQALRPQNPLGMQVRRDPWPCSSMVAAWLQAVQGRTSDSWRGWRAIDADLWDAVNIVDPSQPWSGVIAAYMELGDDIAITMVAPGGAAPQLRSRCWHVVQRWKHVTDDPMTHLGGHAYLVWRDGDTVEVYQSSVFEGYRVNVGTWEGSAGLAGYSVGIAYLAGVPE